MVDQEKIPSTVPGVLLFFRRDAKYLLHLRKNTKFHDGLYSVPGGHIENKESYKQCGVREAEEEVGLMVEEKNLKPVHLICHWQDGELRPDVCFLIEKWEGQIENKESHKHGPPEWFSFHELPKNMPEYVKNAIKNIEQGIFYSEHGFD